MTIPLVLARESDVIEDKSGKTWEAEAGGENIDNIFAEFEMEGFEIYGTARSISILQALRARI